MSKISVKLLHNAVAPYRTPLFNALAQKTDLKVVFCSAGDRDRKWSSKVKDGIFSFSTMRGYRFGPFTFNPFLWGEVWQTRQDVLIAVDHEENIFTNLIFCSWMKLRGKPYVLWSGQIPVEGGTVHPADFHDTIFHRVKPIRWLYFALVNVCIRLLYRGADSFLAYSDASKRHMVAKGADARKIVVGTQAMPTVTLTKSTTKRRKSSTLRLLYLGYLRPEKGVDVLVSAVKNLPEAKIELNIIGDGPEKQRLKDLSAGSKNIHFHPYAEGLEKANWFAASDAFVLPTFYDPWAHVVAESLYYETPVIITDSAAASMVITDYQNGVVVKAGDAKGLQAVFQKLIDHPNLVQQMQKGAAKQNPRLYDVNADAENFVKAIRIAQNEAD